MAAAATIDCLVLAAKVLLAGLMRTQLDRSV